MKYDKKRFEDAVKHYRKALGNVKDKSIFVIAGLDDEQAYYSIAPLSRAVSENGGDIHVMMTDGESAMLDVLLDTWGLYCEMREGSKSAGVDALSGFISVVEKKAGKGKLDRIFCPPEILIKADRGGFVGNISLPYKAGWFKKYQWPMLVKTSDVIWKQVYDLKKTETAGIGFECIGKKLEKPLEDFLDSYAISRAMMVSARKTARKVSMSASSSKESMLVAMEKVGDLKATLSGCEMSKDIDEPVFKKFRELRKYIKTARLKTNDANFFIAGGGFPGKHLFGQVIGYPSPNKKTRWQSPGQMAYKLDYAPQTVHDSRVPISRFGFTDTLPIDIFIKTNNVDWFEIKRKNDALRRVAAKSKKIIVSSNGSQKLKTHFEVGLIKKDGGHRWARGSDIDIRTKINKEYYKMTGIKAGCMANLPGGEMFVTPEYLEGTVVGDVVISINESYPLSAKEPLVIVADKKGYKVRSGPKKVLAELEKRKKEAMEQILEQEKNKSLPKEIIKMKKDNFEKIGEFAINTNPKAELCDYLIVNEKINGMIHVALGSGFEADRASGYHYDIVINAREQKLDIYGLDDRNNKIWAMKQGKLVV